MSSQNQHEVALRAIAAAKQLLGREVVIAVDADFTPVGKRVARIVRHAVNGRPTQAQIRWYVGGRAFRSLPLTAANVELTEAWQLSA